MAKIDRKLIQQARARDKLVEHKEELHYFRFREDFRSIPRGTVLLRNKVLWGFPHIPRIFTLKKGIGKNIHAPFFIEEKIDGFNVRIAKVGDSIYAFSRGGFLDPFATEKAREMKLKKFFAKYPKYMLCGEMLGNTPYTKPTKKFDVKFLVFDIDNGTGSYLPCEEKYKLLKQYGISSVHLYGKFNKPKNAERIAMSILKSKKEGIVIKSKNRAKVVKFVTPFADIDDIEYGSRLLFDLPEGFFLQRVLRSAIFLKDFRLDRSKYGAKLGQAFYKGLIQALKQIEHKGSIIQEFTIRIKDPKIWKKILKHTSKEVKLEKTYQWKKAGYTYIRFKKIYKKTSKKLRDFLRGKSLID